ncbi:hypothetical protein [Alteromonas oceanisediminis]|uniref:hypothetical protein n=1 Tax=Alteromonas oceanisediminis TaxID=2836180 RepID=UPI001BDB002F|nr:hypothetical protein [Alteromonas oceanisediminis]MBT0585937.1 hypothetical protein [Alteromonas oceanisediminis]
MPIFNLILAALRYRSVNIGLIVFALCVCSAAQSGVPTEVSDFYPSTMNAEPYLPADLASRELGCLALSASDSRYRSSQAVDYSASGWEEQISAEWDHLSAPEDNGRITIIDFRQADNRELTYRYLANANSQNELYEPWSSSKIFAYTGAIATLRQQGVGATSKIGNVSVADLITSINSYSPTGNAPDDSNAIATYFANIAGRDFLTRLFHDDWLKLSNPDVRFRGAYGPIAFVPSQPDWKDGQQSVIPSLYVNAGDDPGYQSYRCDDCDLTGNKPMTTLAQAEWLKRLAAHTRDAATQHPHLTAQDIQILFYGSTGRGGMMAGISRMLPNALAAVLEPNSTRSPKAILDQATQGQWRIFQKIGWGPSETRMAGENVVLAHVCLPHFQGGREFTIAAQAAQSGYGDEFVNYAGMKMQDLLTRSLGELLYPQ